jgi:hypothetical protein
MNSVQSTSIIKRKEILCNKIQNAAAAE